ncbi:hypothetical protein L6452_00258 [Arctium lappa]|uniref:Uncharacterized protein n=1 Tax=Arctium lappa TaxID=4217 RepID=A0ACB9FED4_ARCLA|nr:hypothetical protein L6452_00258 [Arctium lappa]
MDFGFSGGENSVSRIVDPGFKSSLTPEKHRSPQNPNFPSILHQLGCDNSRWQRWMLKLCFLEKRLAEHYCISCKKFGMR